ncbi:MAG: hypothetical protein ACRESI_08115 [Gammaproteobacteria bacterium]
MSSVHTFRRSLERSHSASDLPIWLEIYRKAFPDMVACVDHRQDGEHQRSGIDRSLTLANSKQVLIDEKVRFKAYPDIALEYWSDRDRGIPGWVCKPLRADYICYAIAPIGQAYLLPVLQLQAAWRRHSEEWIKRFSPAINAINQDYVTVSCGVPVNVLFVAIGACFRIQFTPQREAV